jgi:hypothetical protein
VSESPYDPTIPPELLDAVKGIEDAQLREDLLAHLIELPGSMGDLGMLLRQPSWVDAMGELFRMEESRRRHLAGAILAVVAQEMKNASGEFERWMRGGTN